MSNEEIIISVYGDDIEGIFAPEDISNLNRLINLARTPPLPIQSDSGVEEEDKAILDEAKTSGTIIHWFDKWCKESKRGGGVLITTSIKELLTDFYNDYASSKTKELVAEIEKLKELIEKLFKSTGNKIILNMWDEDINIVWEQFKTENNL